MWRRLVPITCALVVAIVLAGCASAAAPPPASYDQPPRTVRPNETALHLKPTVAGDTEFVFLGLSTGLPSVVGSHAEYPAKGQFVRLRLVITNTGRTTVTVDTRRQQLLTAGFTAYAPDDQAMQIKRQPNTFDLGAGDRLEFDLYYDIPPGAVPTSMRVYGGPTFADPTGQVGTDVALS